MDKFVTNLKRSANKSSKTELSEDEPAGHENSGQDYDYDHLGMSRLYSYRNILRFSAVNRKDPKVNCSILILN